MASQIIRIRLQGCALRRKEHQAAEPSLRFAKNGENTNPLEDDILLLATNANTLEHTSKNNDKVASPRSFQPPTQMKFLRAQVGDTYFRMGHAQVRHNNFEF